MSEASEEWAHVAGAEQEHGRSVGRRNHRSDQKGLDPTESEQESRNRRRQSRRKQNPDGGECQRRRQHAAEGRQPRTQAAIEQDQGECYRADQIGRADVIKLDPARPGFARQHANQEKDQQQGSTESQRDET